MYFSHTEDVKLLHCMTICKDTNYDSLKLIAEVIFSFYSGIN